MLRVGDDEPFRISDFQTFKAIAEQSAFALSTANLFSEAAEKKRMDEDLQIAYEIQRILLPANAPDVAGFQIAGLNIPARQVSGDYYDYVVVDPEHCGIAIADVSGKGVPASLIMAMCRSVLRSQAAGERSAASALRRVNAQIYPDIKEDMFISHGLRDPRARFADAHAFARRARRAAALFASGSTRSPGSIRPAWPSALTVGASSIESRATFP